MCEQNSKKHIYVLLRKKNNLFIKPSCSNVLNSNEKNEESIS